MSILDAAIWYGNIAATVTVALGLCFAYLYETRTAGAWRRSEIGRHLMWFVLAPTGVIMLALVRAVAGASLDELWFVILRLAVFTSVPLVYAQRIRIFLKVQREERDQ